VPHSGPQLVTDNDIAFTQLVAGLSFRITNNSSSIKELDLTSLSSKGQVIQTRTIHLDAKYSRDMRQIGAVDYISRSVNDWVSGHDGLAFYQINSKPLTTETIGHRLRNQNPKFHMAAIVDINQPPFGASYATFTGCVDPGKSKLIWDSLKGQNPLFLPIKCFIDVE